MAQPSLQAMFAAAARTRGTTATEEMRKFTADVRRRSAAGRGRLGRPRSKRGAENYMKAVATGAIPAQSLTASKDLLNSKALSQTAMKLGTQVLGSIPGAAEVMNWLDIAGQVPVVGELTDKIKGVAEALIGEGFEAIGSVTGGVIGVVEDIPVVGDIVEGVTDVLEEIPLLGSLF